MIRKGIVLILLLVFVDIIWVAARFFILIDSNSTFDPPTVSTISYDNFRSGSAQTSVDINSPYFSISEVDFPIGKDAFRGMPLFFNTYKTSNYIKKKFPQLMNKHIMFFADKSGVLRAYDLKRQSVLWEQKIGIDAYNTGVLDPDLGMLYFSYPFSEVELVSIQIDGTQLKKISANFKSKMVKGLTDEKSFCSTGLSIHKSSNLRYLLLGCSGRNYSEERKETDYGFPGASGFVVGFLLNKYGHFLGSDYYKILYTSPISSSSLTGFNAGVWSSGSAPAILDDGSILFVTSNGSFLPQYNSYGCSILRMNANSFKLESFTPGTPFFYSDDHTNYNECFYYNQELGSSAVSVMKYNSKYYAFAIGKPGRLVLLDPHQMPGSNPEKKNELEITRGNFALYFGQPNLFQLDGNMYAVTTGRTDGYIREDFFLAQEDISARFDNPGRGLPKKLQCAGYIRKNPTPNTKEGVLLYSGRTKEDYVLAMEGSKFYSSLKSIYKPSHITAELCGDEYEIDGKKHWPPYVDFAKVGHLLTESYKEIPDGFIKRPLYLFYGPRNPEDVFQKHHNFPRKRRKFPDPNYPVLEYSNGYVLVANNNDDNHQCEGDPGPEYKKLFLYKRDYVPENKQSCWKVSAVTISEDYRMAKKWEFSPNDECATEVTNVARMMTVAVNKKKNSAFVIAPMVNKEGDLNTLFLINAQTGKLVKKMPLKGRQHFSMPLVIDDKIFFSTDDDGIRMYKMTSVSKLKFLWLNSVILKPFLWILG